MSNLCFLIYSYERPSRRDAECLAFTDCCQSSAVQVAVSDDRMDPNLHYEVGKLNILPHHDPSFEANTEAFLDLLVYILQIHFF